MLVLSRKKGETIVIQDNIEVTVIAVEGETVRIGIQAPKQVDIFRKEVYELIQQSNRESAAPASQDVARLMKHMKNSPKK
ncbi:carbon storage regulator CsrA [Saccharibacillus brassicae]|uniref:Translational regulator CsrA n=1 Tax=Saccharibacillus brassicae TaxID=2583377 RepID=A0A4Y6UT35_SACBS|nr:carbon storage regulator CsrA [Saccharibacillus brassicae]QDH20852.1 carbon storage regulator CsrA [Saccharibacillus brassicae]